MQEGGSDEKVMDGREMLTLASKTSWLLIKTPHMVHDPSCM